MPNRTILFLVALVVIVVAIIAVVTIRENFRFPSKSFSTRLFSNRSTPNRSFSNQAFNTSQFSSPPPAAGSSYTQTPSLGNAYFSPNTGIVQGSYLAPLQNQYKAIFTPRPTSSMSGQTQMQHHLSSPSSYSTSYNPYASPTPQTGPMTPAPGLGLTGWVNSPYNPYNP